MIRAIFVSIMIFFCVNAFGALTEQELQSLKFRNVLEKSNQGFESGRQYWTSTGGTFSAVGSGANFLELGKLNGYWDPGSSGQYVRSALVAIPVWAKGQNGVAYCQAKTLATDIKMNVTDGTNTIASQTLVATSTVVAQKINFVFPSSGSIRLELESQSDSSGISFDDCWIGLADNVGTVAQATFVGSATHPATSNCAWLSTSTSYGNFTADSDCPVPTLVGSALAPSTKVPGIRFASLPSGEYLILAKGSFRDATFDTNGCAFALSDGTTKAGMNQNYAGTNMGSVIGMIAARFKYNTAQGDTTFQIQSRSDSVANTCQVGLADTASEQVLEFQVYRFPLESEQVYRPDIVPYLASATITGGNADLGTGNVTSYTEASNNSLTMVPDSYSNLIGIPCSSTNASTIGSYTCSAGNEVLGATFSVPRAGKYEVCAGFVHRYIVNAVNAAVYTAFQLVETANNGNTILQEGGDRKNSGFEIASGSGDERRMETPHWSCGVFNFSSAGQKTVKLMYEQNVGGVAPLASQLVHDGASVLGQRGFRIVIKSLDQQIPAPLLVNSVVSSAYNVDRLERAIVTYSAGVPSITSQSGDWITSLTDNGTGDLTYNVKTGHFSETPSCVCGSGGGGAQRLFCDVRTASTSSVNVIFYNAATSALADPSNPTTLHCMGPR